MTDKNVNPPEEVKSEPIRYVTFSGGIKRWWTVDRLLGSAFDCGSSPIQKTNPMVLRLKLAIGSIGVIRSLVTNPSFSKWIKNSVEVTLVGWGRRPGTESSLNLAKKHDCPYLALEDGFLRSYGTGEHYPPIALVRDNCGIYYDSRSASDLETMLCSDVDLLETIAKNCSSVPESDLDVAFERIVSEGLSKYNHAPPIDVAKFEPCEILIEAQDDSSVGVGKRILVVDQTVGDMSVVCGGADDDTFQAMLKAALSEHPNATVFVKTHPEVTSGRKSGYLSSILGKGAQLTHGFDYSRVVPLREAIEPASLIHAMDHVYVVSSTMGFEALMHGKPVTCFGVPWYSGWGVTDDRQVCVRRNDNRNRNLNRKRSVKELFAAAYVAYTTYLDPLTYDRGSIHHAIDWLVNQKAMGKFLHGQNLTGRVFVYGFQRWKAYNLKAMLALKPEQLIFVDSATVLDSYSPVSGDTVMVWGADVPAALGEPMARLKQQDENELESADLSHRGLRVLHVEDGFLRSVGLGSDMIKPQSLVFDTRGLYFDARKPSDLEYLLQNTTFSEEELSRAANVRRLIVEHGLTKYNLEVTSGVDWQRDGQRAEQYSSALKSNQCVILVPGQVEDDASIRYGCVDVRTNLDLIKAVRASHPDAWIVYKPHPDVVSGNRVGKLHLNALKGLVDHVETRASVIDCILACDEVHTMTSLTGFDALLRDKRVVTYGQPFYAGWGLTEDRCGESRTAFEQAPAALTRRTRRLCLDELVAGVLLKYPIYWDENLRGYTTCEAVINRLIEERDARLASGDLHKLRVGTVSRLLRKLRVLMGAWATKL